MCGAPLKPTGGLVEAILLLIIPNSFSALIPSMPASAPEGTIIGFLVFSGIECCNSNISGNIRRAHPEIIMNSFCAFMTLSARGGTALGGRHSIIISQFSANSSKLTFGIPSNPPLRSLTCVSLSPLIPLIIAFATAVPIAPVPAIPTVFIA